MQLVGLRGIVFTVLYTTTRRHPLNFAGRNDCAVAHVVFVFDSAGNRIRQNFHVLVRMGSEALPRCDPIFIDHSQRTEVHTLRIVILSE